MIFRCILISLLTLGFAHAKMFQSVNQKEGTFIKQDKTKYFCSNCGMHLPLFYKTNHSHKNHQYCSLHCLYETTKGEIPKDAKVVDTTSLQFIDVKKAYYVVGSKKRGTMSTSSKYAFREKKEAEKFIKKFGGELMDFAQAYKAAKMDFENDKKMIRTKREKKVYKKGKDIYEKKCDKVDTASYKDIANLKASLKERCKVSGDKPIQMAAVYLWDTKKLNKKITKAQKIEVPKDAKCPICGMSVGKYPKWVSMIEGEKEKYYFDGVKDMIKFTFLKKKKFEKIYVSDYFTTNKLEARRAYYVVGSNIYGPMGKEIIPFDSEEKALDFKEDHFGNMVLRFHEITQEIIDEL